MKKYFYLPLDNYQQPAGTVEEIELTKKQFSEIKKNVFSPYYYCFENYGDALRRAQN